MLASKKSQKRRGEVYMYYKDRDEYLHIRLSKKEKARMRAFAKEKGITVTELVLRGVETYIQQRDPEKKYMK
jgi:hypothetical protein